MKKPEQAPLPAALRTDGTLLLCMEGRSTNAAIATRRQERNTARAMSQENVEAFKRATEAGNRRDFEALLEELDPEVEWHPALLGSLEGRATVYRGRAGVREWFRDVYEVLGEVHTEFSEIRDLGDRIVAIGSIRTRGEVSGAETESPLAYVTEYKNGKATRVQSYLDPKEALEAAGLRE